jgi:hypothetical protein
MKLLLFKTLLQRRARDEGFTLPMVIALGLVMVLLGVISLTTANEETITAISQNSKSDALAVAEVGVARYRELLDRNRVLTVYDSADWSGIPQVCDDDIAASLLGAFKPVTLLENGQDLNNDGDSNDNDPKDPNNKIGDYALVSYEYINDDDEDGNLLTPGIANGFLDLTSDAANKNARGRLTVQGSAADGSEAQIQVEIPVRINPDDMTNLAPALWIGDNTISATDLGNLTIGNGNVVIKDQAVTTGTKTDGCRPFANLAVAGTRPVISDGRDLPKIQKIIDDVANAESVTSGSRKNTFDPASPPVTFGTTSNKAYNPDIVPSKFQASDCKSIKLCRYYYAPTTTTAITYTDKDMVTDGIAKTTLLLEQDLKIDAATTPIKVGSSTNFGSSDAFEIYVRGNGNDITINAMPGRTINVRAFIHAPDSTLTITGTGTVNIFGSVWVNDFENRTATVNITPDDIKSNATTGDKSYKYYSTTPGRTPKPLTGSPTNWKTEEVE